MANYPYMNYQQPQFGGMGYQMPVYNQQNQMAQSAAQGLTMRLVTSREEVAAAQIPFDGSTTYFADTSNGKIYAKTFDPGTGTAPIVTYAREIETPVRYATYEDLAALADTLRTELRPKRRAVKNDDADAE